MSQAAPICMSCKHFDRAADDLSCAAFPDGIPDAIIENRLDHRQPIDGDNGIQFEQGEGLEPLNDIVLELLGGGQQKRAVGPPQSRYGR